MALARRLASGRPRAGRGEAECQVDPTDEAGLTERIGRLLDGVGTARPLTLRENLHPYRFADCAGKLTDFLGGL